MAMKVGHTDAASKLSVRNHLLKKKKKSGFLNSQTHTDQMDICPFLKYL